MSGTNKITYTETNLQWDNIGTAPTSQKKADGFVAGDKLPASTENYLRNQLYAFLQDCIDSVNENADILQNIGLYNVLDYAGADTIWDGSTSANTAITAALVAMNSNGVKGTLYFPNKGASTYLLTGNISLASYSDITLKFGAGAKIDLDTFTITGNNTKINAGLEQIFDVSNGSSDISGSWIIENSYIEWFGAVGDGVTDDERAIELAIKLKPYRVIFKDNTTYAIDGKIKITNDNVLFYLGQNTKLKWTSLEASDLTGTVALEITGDNFKIINGILQGTTSGAYGANQHLLQAYGSSSTNKLDKITIENVEFYDSGSSGIWLKFVKNINISKSYVHDIGYQGMVFLSCTGCVIDYNNIKDITPGTGGSMYGIMLTNSTQTAPNIGEKNNANHFCYDFKINNNTIEEIANDGIIAFGCYDTIVSKNHIYACGHIGISLSENGNYGGRENQIIDNMLDARSKDGTTSGYENTGTAINISGGSINSHESVMCINNICKYWGETSNSAGGVIIAHSVNGSIIGNNVFQYWGGNGVYANTSDNLNIHDNIFKGIVNAGDTEGVCIKTLGTCPNLKAHDNNTTDDGGNAPKIGFYSNDSVNRPFLNSNNWLACVTTLILNEPGFLFGNDYPNIINAADGDTTPSIGGVNKAQLIIMNCDPQSANITLTNIDNGVISQRVLIRNLSATYTVTIDRTNAVLDGGVNAVLGQYDNLCLIKGESYWEEISRSDNS